MVHMAADSFGEVEASPVLDQPRYQSVSGERAAWRQLHRQYHPVAAAFLRKLGVRETDLEDACQEVFLQMFRYLSTFRGESELETWLYRLCITQARRARLRHKVTHALEQLLAFLPGEALVSSPSFSEPTAQRRIASALGQLSDKERTVFVLYEMEGVAGKQIASIVGCTEATLWRRLHYAREAFKRALQGEEVAA
jgi:RNA polymerase sigma-70 factor (ECF subfamily)